MREQPQGPVHATTTTWSTHIASRCKEVESGARNVDHILTRTLLPEVSAEFLTRMAQGESISSVEVAVDGDGNFLYTIQ